jgi:hypothetical protein
VKRVGLAVAIVALATTLGSGAATRADESQACARGYSPCLPVTRDLDCGQIPASKKPVRVRRADPYRLDTDRDGLGCEVAGRGGGSQSPWGLILRKPPRREARSATVGDVLTVVGWSPALLKGQRFELCVMVPNGRTCRPGPKSWVLRGKVQTFARWRVTRGEGRAGVFKLSLQVQGAIRVADTVPLR